jgi:hypothetical protein
MSVITGGGRVKYLESSILKYAGILFGFHNNIIVYCSGNHHIISTRLEFDRGIEWGGWNHYPITHLFRRAGRIKAGRRTFFIGEKRKHYERLIEQSIVKWVYIPRESGDMIYSSEPIPYLQQAKDHVIRLWIQSLTDLSPKKIVRN